MMALPPKKRTVGAYRTTTGWAAYDNTGLTWRVTAEVAAALNEREIG